LPARLLVAAVVTVLLLTACKTQPSDDSLKQTIANLEGTNEELSLHIDRLTADRAGLRQEVRTLQAEVDKHTDTTDAVEAAKGAISAEVRRVIDEFQGDADIVVERAPGGYRLLLREKVLYESGSASLKADGREALTKVAAALKDGRGHVSIEGHTDNVQMKAETKARFPHGNMSLSIERAISVWHFLVNEGKIDESRLSVSGFGSHRPRAPNDSERNKWRNRRVEIRVADE
jgi:chemotaxis protein MotB